MNNIFPRLKSGVFYPKEDVLSSSIHPRSEDRGILEVSNKAEILSLSKNRGLAL
jgi:hypothetical protein